MKKIYHFFTVLLLVSIVIVTTSSVPAHRETTLPGTENPVAGTASTALPADGIMPKSTAPKITYKELKTLATQLKGQKLTFKEKLGLKLFGKKIANKLSGSGKLSGKSQVVALILCWLVGVLGIHRFYLGYTWQGIVQLLTLGGCGIWALIDFIRIITGDLRPKDEDYETTF